MQDGNEGSHDTTVNETPPSPVTEALSSAKILEKVGLRNPEVTLISFLKGLKLKEFNF